MLLQFLARFKNPLVILLLVAGAISAFTGELTNFVIITVMVLFSVTLDFVQERRAGKAAESLSHSVSLRARVIRDGKSIEITVTEVVPGVLAVLCTGDMVPSDGMMLEANDLFVKQALLTGESHPVEKHPGPPAANCFADAFEQQQPGKRFLQEAENSRLYSQHRVPDRPDFGHVNNWDGKIAPDKFLLHSQTTHIWLT